MLPLCPFFSILLASVYRASLSNYVYYVYCPPDLFPGLEAHLMDVAVALAGLSATSRFAGHIEKHRAVLGRVAGKNWKSDEIELEESGAVCQILGALGKTLPPPE